jgi:pimeloyl-ACP methyl ester carboxylesterase
VCAHPHRRYLAGRIISATVSEAQALVRLGAEELASAPQGIKAFHHATAERAFKAVGPAGRPVQLVHDAISGAVYGGLGHAVRLGGSAVETAIGRRQAQLLSDTPRGAAMLAIVNGLIGDTLEAEQSPLQQPMAIRMGGVPVGVEAFPQATPRVAVFLHGLMETEFSWGRAPNYGSRLAEEAGWTPVFVRYNTGLRISQNGHCLADLLDDAVGAWPVQVREIALIGHSMGGLVARSATHQAASAGFGWVERVSHVVSLGTPHRGAPLEEIVHVGSAALDLLPETRPVSRFLRRRSGGIRDLRRGSLVDDDWKDRDPDALRATACKEIPLLEGAKHCFVSASVTRSPRNPLGRLIGDMLVLSSSAAPWREEQAFHLGGVSHFALLNHPEVYARLREWLA